MPEVRNCKIKVNIRLRALEARLWHTVFSSIVCGDAGKRDECHCLDPNIEVWHPIWEQMFALQKRCSATRKAVRLKAEQDRSKNGCR